MIPFVRFAAWGEAKMERFVGFVPEVWGTLALLCLLLAVLLGR